MIENYTGYKYCKTCMDCVIYVDRWYAFGQHFHNIKKTGHLDNIYIRNQVASSTMGRLTEDQFVMLGTIHQVVMVLGEQWVA